jgi:hypothetical protein
MHVRRKDRKKEGKKETKRRMQHTKTEVTQVATVLIKYQQAAPQLLLRAYFSDKPDSRSMAICISLAWSQGCFYRTS